MQKRKIRIKSGGEEIQMEVTEDEYQRFYRPWWQQKKKEQRNREAMEAQGYRTESYEEWKENDMRTELFSESLEEMVEKNTMLEVLKEALDSLMPEERELAEKVFGEEMQVSEYARLKRESRTTVSSRKQRLLDKLRKYFAEQGLMCKEKVFRQSFCICRKLFKKSFVFPRHITKKCHYDSEREWILIFSERRYRWNAEHD